MYVIKDKKVHTYEQLTQPVKLRHHMHKSQMLVARCGASRRAVKACILLLASDFCAWDASV